MANTLGKINPFRYRSYVYDEETKLYYLRSRYFCNSICRFLNSDSLLALPPKPLIINQFCYCINAPILLSDHDGYLVCSDLKRDDFDFDPYFNDSGVGGCGGFVLGSGGTGGRSYTPYYPGHPAFQLNKTGRYGIASKNSKRREIIATPDDAWQFFCDITAGGTPYHVDGIYNPIAYLMPDGTIIVYRGTSSSGSPTIDFNNEVHYRVHFEHP